MAAAGTLVGVLVALFAPTAPASAHGTLTSPISRTAACGTEGGATARSAACRAAVAASQPGAAEAWDNLRVAGVDGRDRSVIPDGKLCSGGLDQYAGLDLPRTDWPTTTVTPGARFTFRYATTIPHQGTFKLFVTKASYRPGRALRWADLNTKPFLTITDPRISNGAYVLPGTMPKGLTGHHVIYGIWQNSSTADTYYSCSDVLFGAGTEPAKTKSPSPVSAAQGGSGGIPAAASGSASPAATHHHHDAAPSTAPDQVEPSAAAVQEPAGMMNGSRWPLIAGIGLTLAVLGAIGLLALHYRPKPRHRRG
ncbi:lytic polysaccharide monooxygenase [Cryptosporangium phraense]|uniref:Lytic polysaccharide monooxygenase n=1 Tax=Cryptosporangium phraense TaxID=2593070 RepID=A0A545AFU0_9ACTN|nr:lytic polysaccharide monooxygenase [Cryptosporangium phraense]